LVLETCRRGEPPVHEFGPEHTVLCVRAPELGRPVLDIAHRGSVEHEDPDVHLSIRDVTAFHGEREIVARVSFDVRATECVALVGESGSGKTTLSRCLVGLHSAWAGQIQLGSDLLLPNARDRTVDQRRKLQYVFQSPYNSLNPRRTVADIVRSPVEYFLGLRGARAEQRVRETIERVALTPAVIWRYPDELSGGERQRVAIARALAAQPEILICDEVTSALDASVQAAIIALLENLQKEEKLALLFVTHNIALVRTIAQRVLVLSDGRVVESGAPDDVIGAPTHPYTQQLVRDTPSLVRMGEELAGCELREESVS
jgi:peptide/nickel transport system ATP-binding protein